MTYTIEQFLAAAEAAEVSMIDAQHICDTLVKMNEQIEIGMFRRMKEYDHPFEYGEIVLIIGLDEGHELCYLAENKHGNKEWITNHTHEPTTETF